MTVMLRIIERLWLPFALVVLWWVVSANSSSVFFPPLSKIMEAMVVDLTEGTLLHDLGVSVTNLFGGLAIAVVVGVTVGVLLGELPRVRETVDPLIHFFRAVPQTALVPLVIGAMGVGVAPKIATIAFACVWPIMLNSIDGVRAVEPAVRSMSQAYRIPPLLHFGRVILPSSLPQIVAGVRVALPIGVVVMVVSELFAAEEGIGHYILSSSSVFQLPQTWAGALLVGVLGYVLSELFAVLERRLLRWHHRSTNPSQARVPTTKRRK
ncbi:ABC transporter permease [Salinibacterium hongtaonis]|uniref:ABC transporter permease n=2 Tax=Homoserinimonas hongtaonis TaxID=2079791 RepID=A0A2U1T1K6_9MICO|nr:ABC transporter permease [Salinibacterium hongtaonis]